MQIVAVNDQIAIERHRPDAFLRGGDERSKWDRQIVIVDEIFALEIQLGHFIPPPKMSSPHRIECRLSMQPPCCGLFALSRGGKGVRSGYWVGRALGTQLCNHPFQAFEPIPLHRYKRRLLRG
jgi:hypothetical protein